MSERVRQPWMGLRDIAIAKMSDRLWERYSNRECVCLAWHPEQCLCGAMDEDLTD